MKPIHRKKALLIITAVIAALSINDVGAWPPKPTTVIIFLGVLSYAILSIYEESGTLVSERNKSNTGTLNPPKTQSDVLLWRISSVQHSIPGGRLDLQKFVPKGGTFLPQNDPLYDPFEGVRFQAWIENSDIKVSTIIKDAAGEVVATMEANEWTVNPNNSYDRNFDEKALEVVDNSGKVVFQIEINNNEIFMNGIFFRPDGDPLIINEVTGDDGLPTGSIGTIAKADYMEWKNHASLVVKKIFTYPSERHPGKRGGKGLQFGSI